MQNYNLTGDTVPMTVPAGGVVSGMAYLINQVVVVASSTIATAGAKFQARTRGVFTLPKAAGAAIAEGAIVYWDNVNSVVTTTSAGNTKMGMAIDGGALSAATVVKIRLQL